ncbi:hypothetical protein [Bilifractor porci]|uniref:Uncharacterized protein n=1 Tax=Bilifractor porci TaxID=2606636 RepID=A0A7X2P7M7_9FIRM|nr:hypothetical protein [Bilifractor porci]MST81560.1 hypothetical protein [Bilifractor porci]
MMEWAEREVYEFIRGCDNKEYARLCCDSTLKAYHSLMEDGHSGMSIGITKNILDKLIEGKPLTMIEDIQDVWGYSSTDALGNRIYQCKRMSSLFKTVDRGMNSKYSDVDRVRCVDKFDCQFSSGIATRYVDEHYPIKMPYDGSDKYVFTTDEFLLDEANGQFDFFALLTLKINGNQDYDFNPVYYDLRSDGKPIEISESTYNEYKQIAKRRKK